MNVRALWRPAMWTAAGVSVLNMEDLTPADMHAVTQAADAYEKANEHGCPRVVNNSR